MTEQLLRLLVLAPSLVPPALALALPAAGRFLHSPRGYRLTMRGLLVVLLLAAVPLLPVAGIPRQTPLWTWATSGDLVLQFGLTLETPSSPGYAPLSLTLMAAGILGVWSLMRLSASSGSGALTVVPLCAILLIIGGGQLAVQSLTPLGVVLGAGVVALGVLAVEIWGIYDQQDVRGFGLLAVVVPLLLLAMAALTETASSAPSPFWLAGCGLLLLTGPTRVALTRAPLLVHASAHALGLSTVGACLLAEYVLLHGLGFAGATLLPWGASAMLILGAINVVTATSLRALLSAQWIAQLGLLLLALGVAPANAGLIYASIINMVISTLVLSLLLGHLAQVAGTERIAGLSAPTVSLQHIALPYGIAAAAVAGLPFTLGYTVRQSLSLAERPYLEPLLLACSTLLLVGLVPPLVALVRRPVQRKEGPNPAEQGDGAMPLDEEPGWALPYTGLAQALAPLTPVPWQMLLGGLQARREGVTVGVQATSRNVARGRLLLAGIALVVGAIMLVWALG